MKRIYLLIYSVITLFSINAKAIDINVSVTNNAFAPQTFTANIGDIVIWTWNSSGMTHNVTSTPQSVPSGAAALASGNKTSGTYSYTINTAGNYGYVCTIHSSSGMTGGFTVNSSTGIIEPATDLLTSVFPNPFKDKTTIKYNKVDLIDVFNMLGEKVKTIELVPGESKIEIDFENLPSGIYFYRTYYEGIIMETKRIIKSK